MQRRKILGIASNKKIKILNTIYCVDTTVDIHYIDLGKIIICVNGKLILLNLC
jgi:hypothetical protein